MSHFKIVTHWPIHELALYIMSVFLYPISKFARPQWAVGANYVCYPSNRDSFSIIVIQTFIAFQKVPILECVRTVLVVLCVAQVCWVKKVWRKRAESPSLSAPNRACS